MVDHLKIHDVIVLHHAKHDEFGTQMTIEIPRGVPAAVAEEIEDQLYELACELVAPHGEDVFATAFRGRGCGWPDHPLPEEEDAD